MRALGGFIEVRCPVGEDVQPAFHDLQSRVFRGAGFPSITGLRGVEHREEITGMGTDIRIIAPGMLGVVGEQIDAGFALVLRLVVQIRTVGVERQVLVVRSVARRLEMVVGIVLEITVRHQVIGRHERLRPRLARIGCLAYRGAGEGDTTCLRSVAPYIKERVVHRRGAQCQGRIQTKGQYSQ